MSGGDKFCQIRDLKPAVGNNVGLGSDLGDSHGWVVVVDGYSGLRLAHFVEIGVDAQEQVRAKKAARDCLSVVCGFGRIPGNRVPPAGTILTQR